MLIDTAADPHYNGTGLQRVTTNPVWAFSLTVLTAWQLERAYAPDSGPKVGMTPGIQWKDAANPDGPWLSLADFVLPGTRRQKPNQVSERGYCEWITPKATTLRLSWITRWMVLVKRAVITRSATRLRIRASHVRIA